MLSIGVAAARNNFPQCIDAGFHNFYFSVNYLKEQIKDYFGDGVFVYMFDIWKKLTIGYRRGTSLLPEKPTVPILVLNGDVLTRVDFRNSVGISRGEQFCRNPCVREHRFQSSLWR